VVGEEVLNILTVVTLVVLVEEIMVICRMHQNLPFIRLQSIQEQVEVEVAVLLINPDIPQEEILESSSLHINNQF
jgi:hypothetical protein